MAEAGINEFATNRDKADFLAAMRKLPVDLKTQIEAAAQKFRIPENLAFAQIFSESSFKPKAQSPVNPGVGRAFGLTQGIKGTLGKYGFSVEEVLKSPEKSLSVNAVALEAAKLNQYNFTYEGKERIDEIDTYIFYVVPKAICLSRDNFFIRSNLAQCDSVQLKFGC